MDIDSSDRVMASARSTLWLGMLPPELPAHVGRVPVDARRDTCDPLPERARGRVLRRWAGAARRGWRAVLVPRSSGSPV